MAGRICRIALAAIAACAPAAASPQDDDAPPALVAVGSDGMGPLLRAWAEDLAHADPGFVLEVETLGSSTAPPALVSGRADVGAMTREMKWAEREVFRSRYGYDPVRVRVALDAVMVFVHPKNSIESRKFSPAGEPMSLRPPITKTLPQLTAVEVCSARASLRAPTSSVLVKPAAEASSEKTWPVVVKAWVAPTPPVVLAAPAESVYLRAQRRCAKAREAARIVNGTLRLTV